LHLTARLPGDSMIWPLPKLDVGKNTILVKGIFVDQKEICSYNQGNWKKQLFQITYKVISSSDAYPYKIFSFVCTDSSPAEGSLIRVKKLNWHFLKGEKTFYLSLDKTCDFKKYFDIITYQ
jgi:hypothetical protein